MTTIETVALATDAGAEASQARAAARQARADAQAADRELQSFTAAANVRADVLLAALVDDDPDRRLEERLRGVLRAMRVGDIVAPTDREELRVLADDVLRRDVLIDALDRLPRTEFSALSRAGAQSRAGVAHRHVVAAGAAARAAEVAAGIADAAWTSLEGIRSALGLARGLAPGHPSGISDERRAEFEASIVEHTSRAEHAAGEADAACERAAGELVAMRAALAGDNTKED
jgi:hypothetical protein